MSKARRSTGTATGTHTEEKGFAVFYGFKERLGRSAMLLESLSGPVVRGERDYVRQVRVLGEVLVSSRSLAWGGDSHAAAAGRLLEIRASSLRPDGLPKGHRSS